MEYRTPTVSPLRQRMLEDMRMRKFQPRTQAGYIRAVLRLTHFLERSPDTATADDLRRFQVQLADDGATPATINVTLSGLKFFYEVTVGQGAVMAKVAPVRLPQTLPVVLSREEVARLLGAVTNLKHHTALSVAYGTGLRASEVIGLKVTDVDSQRMTLRVELHIYHALAQRLIVRARTLYAQEQSVLELDASVYALDSTTIDLCLSLFEWAPFRSTKAAIKLHTLLDLRGAIPAFIHISDGKLHDVNVLDILPVEAKWCSICAPTPGKRSPGSRAMSTSVWNASMAPRHALDFAWTMTASA